VANITTLNRPPMRAYSNSASLMEVIARAASDPAVDVSKMQSLLDMQERLAKREAEQQFNIAMHKAQSEMHTIGVDRANTSTKSKYASYAKLDTVMRPIYSRHGFALSFDTAEGAPENYVRVLCYVMHSEGHVKTYSVDMPADGKGAKGGDVMTKTHAEGSAMSYGARYLLKFVFNVAVGEHDDDGNGADPTTAGPQGTITEDQLKTLTEMIVATKADVVKLCVYFNIEQIGDLPSKAFGKAIDMLKLKAQQAKAKP
jgi:hypothetical protein